MKRTIAIILSLVMAVLFVGCAEEAPVNVYESDDSEKSFFIRPEAEPITVDGIDNETILLTISHLSERGYEVKDITLEEIRNAEKNEILECEKHYTITFENEHTIDMCIYSNIEDAKQSQDVYLEILEKYYEIGLSPADLNVASYMWLYKDCTIEYDEFGGEFYLPLCELFGAPFVGSTDIMEVIETSDIQYIRTNQIGGEFVNNTIVLIESAEALAKYYEANKETFDLERRETVYSDTSVGFLDACDTYTDEWFETNNLLLVIVGEGSGSVRHKITSVTIRNYDLESFDEEDFALQINMQRLVPEVGTCDMAEWHIMIGVPKRDLPEVMGLGVNETWDTDFGWIEPEPIRYFSNGMLAVQVDGLFGYIDKSGEFAIKPQFDSALRFASNGLACVCIDDKFGYINTKGDIVIEPQYDLGYSFEECGLAAVCIDKKFGFIDSSGNYVFKPTFSWVSGAFYTPEGTFGKYGIACVRIGDYPDSKFAFVDINGNYVTEPIFDNAHSFADNGLAAVMISDIHSQKWGYINTSGEYVIQPKEYSYVGDFASNGLANVLTVSGKYGYIDETGKYAIEPRFTYAGDFGENGYAVVSVDSKYGIIDANGNYVIEPKSDYVSNFADNGLAVVKIGAKSGYVNMEGKFVIEPIYIRTGNFVNGLASVNEGRGDGYINEKGEYVIEPREDIYNAYPFDDDGYAVIRGEENWTVINRNGETVFGPFDWINCDSKLWFGQNYESMFEPE